MFESGLAFQNPDTTLTWTISMNAATNEFTQFVGLSFPAPGRFDSPLWVQTPVKRWVHLDGATSTIFFQMDVHKQGGAVGDFFKFQFNYFQIT
jgi:hypothetical protein